MKSEVKASENAVSADVAQRAANAIWDAARGAWGKQRWEREFGKQPSQLWVHGLAKFSREEIARGYNAIASGRWKFPVTWPEFSEVCRAHSTQTPEQAALYGRMDQQAALPSSDELMTSSREGMQWLAYMWREGHAKRPASVGLDRVAQLLEGADLDGMRERYEAGLSEVRKMNGIPEPEPEPETDEETKQ